MCILHKQALIPYYLPKEEQARNKREGVREKLAVLRSKMQVISITFSKDTSHQVRQKKDLLFTLPHYSLVAAPAPPSLDCYSDDRAMLLNAQMHLDSLS